MHLFVKVIFVLFLIAILSVMYKRYQNSSSTTDIIDVITQAPTDLVDIVTQAPSTIVDIITQAPIIITPAPIVKNTQPLCINDTCLSEDDLKRYIASINATPAPIVKNTQPLCINNTCLTEDDMTRYMSVIPKGYINVVNRRPLIGVGINQILKPVGGDATSMSQLLPNTLYNPFSYNVPPPKAGTTRMWRMYATYSDNIVSKDNTNGPIVDIQVQDGSWNKAVADILFQFPPTWGTTNGDSRDAYSSIVADPPTKYHSKLFSYIANNPDNKYMVQWFYLELQALDVYP